MVSKSKMTKTYRNHLQHLRIVSVFKHDHFPMTVPVTEGLVLPSNWARHPMAGQYGEGGRGSPAHGGVNLVAVRKVHNMYIYYIYIYPR